MRLLPSLLVALGLLLSIVCAPLHAATTADLVSQDIGAPALAGSTTVALPDMLTLTASGRDIWDKADQFRFAHVPLEGDGEIVVRVASLTAGVHVWSKAGLMIRESLDAGSRHASIFVTPASGVSFQRRLQAGGSSQSNGTGAGTTAPRWLKLIRAGNLVTAAHSVDGQTWSTLGSATLALPARVFAGLAITSHHVGQTVTASFTELALPGHTDSDILAAGLAAFRTPDADGLRCADCHAPNGYDIALFNFTRDDVRRAGAPHLSQEQNDAIYDMLEVLRATYPPAGGLKDFRTFRPLQPGGEVVGGADSPVDVRDAAFGDFLKTQLTMAREPVTTLALARAAAQELVDLDLFSVPVGIKMNLWSRSMHREGAQAGGEIAEWLPGIALQPKPEFAAQWWALQDAYIANPTEENLWAILHRTRDWVQPDPHNFVAGITAPLWFEISLNQYRSNLLFQHDQLQRALGQTALLDVETGARPFPEQIPNARHYVDLATVWHVGDGARGVSPEFAALPTRHQESVFTSPTVTVKDQIRDLQMPWMYLGWLFDNGLRHSGNNNATLAGEYFIGQLWVGTAEDLPKDSGLRNHYVFFNAAHQYKRAFLPGAWNSGDRAVTDGRDPYFSIKKNYYLGYGRWKKSLTVAGYPAADADYKRLLGNHLRMNLLIHADEIARLGVVIVDSNSKKLAARDALLSDAELYRTVLAWTDPDRAAADGAIVDAYRATVLAHPYQ